MISIMDKADSEIDSCSSLTLSSTTEISKHLLSHGNSIAEILNIMKCTEVEH